MSGSIPDLIQIRVSITHVHAMLCAAVLRSHVPDCSGSAWILGFASLRKCVRVLLSQLGRWKARRVGGKLSLNVYTIIFIKVQVMTDQMRF